MAVFGITDAEHLCSATTVLLHIA